MKIIATAIALVIAAPAAAQTAPASQHQGHSQQQHGQAQQHGQGQHGQHQQHGQGQHGQHQQGQQHGGGCCADRNGNGRMDCCEEGQNGGNAECCEQHGENRSGPTDPSDD